MSVSSTQIALFIWEEGNGPRLTAIQEFCVDMRHGCATSFTSYLANCVCIHSITQHMWHLRRKALCTYKTLWVNMVSLLREQCYNPKNRSIRRPTVKHVLYLCNYCPFFINNQTFFWKFAISREIHCQRQMCLLLWKPARNFTRIEVRSSIPVYFSG